ncbi:hypothetical protein [Streptomyces sp. NPDC003327]
MTTPRDDGTSSSSSPTAPVGGRQGEDPGALLTAHAALVLVAAGFIALITGGLAYLSTGNAAGAALTGLVTAGAGAVGLHRLVGH